MPELLALPSWWTAGAPAMVTCGLVWMLGASDLTSPLIWAASASRSSVGGLAGDLARGVQRVHVGRERRGRGLRAAAGVDARLVLLQLGRDVLPALGQVVPVARCPPSPSRSTAWPSTRAPRTGTRSRTPRETRRRNCCSSARPRTSRTRRAPGRRAGSPRSWERSSCAKVSHRGARWTGPWWGARGESCWTPLRGGARVEETTERGSSGWRTSSPTTRTSRRRCARRSTASSPTTRASPRTGRCARRPTAPRWSVAPARRSTAGRPVAGLLSGSAR